MNTVILQYRRLLKHYDSCLEVYDLTNLLDLSHTLRIWCELKTNLKENHSIIASQKIFTGVSFSKSLVNTYRNNEFIFLSIPNGVITYASNCNPIIGSKYFDKNGKFKYEFISKINRHQFELKQLIFINNVNGKILNSIPITTNLNYLDWLGSEAIRINYVNNINQLEMISISIESIIKRLANSFEGSHPENSNIESNNKFYEPVKYLFNYICAGLPLPYFILLGIAKEIINNFKDIDKE
jgi:hypothetical protein